MRKFISYISYNLKLLRFFWSKPDIKKDSIQVSNLRKDGIMVIDDFKNHCKYLDELNKFTDNLDIDYLVKQFDSYRIDGKRGRVKKEFRTNITKLFDEELLINYSKNKYINNIIFQYFGFYPTLRSISVWIDVPNENTKEEVATQVFHRDFDDIKLIKTFLYLNDVSKENGPFEYIIGSHLKPWKNENSIIDNETFLKKFKEENLKSVIGKKNTLVIADTNGFHHGKKLTKNYRIMLTASYTSKKPSVKINNSLFE